MKTIITLLLLTGCAHYVVAPETPEPTPPVVIVGNTELPPAIVYDPVVAYDSEKEFIEEGQNRANKVLASECFKNAVLTAKFTENKGLSNIEIFDMFVKHSPYKVGITMFSGGFIENKVNHTVAYEGDPIRMNRYFVYEPNYVASASLHEAFGHGLGFTHYTPKMNPTSIPYLLNDIYNLCVKKIM